MSEDKKTQTMAALTGDFNESAPHAGDHKAPPDIDRFDPTHIMLRGGIISLLGPVDEKMYRQFEAQLTALEAEVANGTRKSSVVELRINSPGGYVTVGLAMYDLIKASPLTINTYCLGQAASMGSFLLSAGANRAAFPSARVMVHRASGGAGGNVTDTLVGGNELDYGNRKLTDLYVAHTGFNHDFWEIVLKVDTYLSAEQARKIGLVDKVFSREAPNKSKYAEDAGLVLSASTAARLAEIAAMSSEQVVLKILGAQSDSSDWVKFRSALVERLADFPQFMTPKRRAEWESKNGPTNDNATSAAPTPTAGAGAPAPGI